ncbi:glycyl-radical enzyme activating protein [Oleidesulfovibrio sp.]|uniref:glycyl-radical enzyme activating protein n=1 Tax=Oleidesulfovibrio sp. TaxID=2909707 RepID=UPI003A8513F4
MTFEEDNRDGFVGQVLNIQRYSTHDGPGIRTTVFLKGCPLRCFWCQNPETQSLRPALSFRKDKCTSCGRCVAICPHQANKIIDGQMVIDREACNVCGDCAETHVCLSKARKIEGKSMTVNEIIDNVSSDYHLYMNTGGGITVSGGDPETQPDFTANILKSAHDNLIHTAVEITGAFPWKTVKKVTEHCDYILFDLKCMDDEKHKEGTGVSNKLILENAKKLVDDNRCIHFRTPLIPGFNDSRENIQATALFIREELGLVPSEHLTLLPYNSLGEEKYMQMGYENARPRYQRQSDAYLEELNEIIASA